MESENKLVLFEKKQIRQVEYNDELYFNIVDVMAALTDSTNPRLYWAKLKERMSTTEGASQTLTECQRLKFLTIDGKKREMDAANQTTLLRIIQSVPSPKAEPFKQWLAQVGSEKIAEINDPELGYEHLRELYRAKGYEEKWIVNRLKSIEIRNELTDEWKKRGVTEGAEYSILTAEIAKETFGLVPKEHAQLKGLDKQNLRDHMTNLELVFTMLGEEVTRNTAINEDAQGFNENLGAAQKGGQVAGNARRNAEQVMGIKVVSAQNFLDLKTDKTQELPQNED